MSLGSVLPFSKAGSVVSTSITAANSSERGDNKANAKTEGSESKVNSLSLQVLNLTIPNQAREIERILGNYYLSTTPLQCRQMYLDRIKDDSKENMVDRTLPLRVVPKQEIGGSFTEDIAKATGQMGLWEFINSNSAKDLLNFTVICKGSVINADGRIRVKFPTPANADNSNDFPKGADVAVWGPHNSFLAVIFKHFPKEVFVRPMGGPMAAERVCRLIKEKWLIQTFDEAKKMSSHQDKPRSRSF